MAEVGDVGCGVYVAVWQVVVGYILQEPCAGVVAVVWRLVAERPHIVGVQVADASGTEHGGVDVAQERLGTVYLQSEALAGVAGDAGGKGIFSIAEGVDGFSDEYVGVHEQERLVEVVHEPLHGAAVFVVHGVGSLRGKASKLERY